MRNFDNWNTDQLAKSFGLKEVKNHPVLTQWLASKVAPTQAETDTLLFLQRNLQEYADAWNEDEVKFCFIAPLVTLIDFWGETYRPHTQRFLRAHPKDLQGASVEIGGKPDMMVATGKVDPEEPYFFLHEYKTEGRRDGDPKGQLLAAMFAAQEKNKLEIPLLGCYVVGRWWFFMVLDGRKWSRSLAFDATLPALFDIFSILQAAREKIGQMAARMATQESAEGAAKN